MYDFKKDKTIEKGTIFRNKKFLKEDPNQIFELKRKKKFAIATQTQNEEKSFQSDKVENDLEASETLNLVETVKSEVEGLKKKVIELEKWKNFLNCENYKMSQHFDYFRSYINLLHA